MERFHVSYLDFPHGNFLQKYGPVSVAVKQSGNTVTWSTLESMVVSFGSPETMVKLGNNFVEKGGQALLEGGFYTIPLIMLLHVSQL